MYLLKYTHIIPLRRHNSSPQTIINTLAHLPPLDYVMPREQDALSKGQKPTRKPQSIAAAASLARKLHDHMADDFLGAEECGRRFFISVRADGDST